MIYCFDLDGTLCTLGDCLEYDNASPIEERIEKVNSLYDDGHTIIIETARGTVSKINWHEKTIEQLNQWGVKYHTLRTGIKHAADIYIDDKGQHSDGFFSE
jgi:histidinol phosphatase-like enzyme